MKILPDLSKLPATRGDRTHPAVLRVAEACRNPFRRGFLFGPKLVASRPRGERQRVSLRRAIDAAVSGALRGGESGSPSSLGFFARQRLMRLLGQGVPVDVALKAV